MTAEKINDVVMGWPIGFQKQCEIAEAMRLAHEQQATHVVGCWCAQTGFALLVEIVDGKPFYWHCTGPINVHQAERWLKGMETADATEPVRMVM